jgi:hypothetical protein
MKRPVPQADPAAYARMKYELENRLRPGLIHRTISPFESRPDVNLAAKSGAPAMQAVRPAIPVSVPAIAAGTQTGISDVAASVVGNSEAIDKTPDARFGVPAAGTPAAAATSTGTGEGEQKAALGTSTTPRPELGANPNAPATNPTPASSAALPTNHPPTKAQLKAYTKQVERAQKLQQKKAAAAKPAATTATPAAASSSPAAATTPAPAQPATPQQ